MDDRLVEDLGVKVGTTEGLSVVGDLPPDDDFCYAAGGWLAKKAGAKVYSPPQLV